MTKKHKTKLLIAGKGEELEKLKKLTKICNNN